MQRAREKIVFKFSGRAKSVSALEFRNSRSSWCYSDQWEAFTNFIMGARRGQMALV